MMFATPVLANCSNDIAVDGEFLYWTKGDNLYGGRLPKNEGKLINPGGWCNASIAVSDGYFYWTQPLDDNLYAARIHELEWRGGTEKMTEGGWRNTDIAVSKGYLYWAALDTRDGLFAARIDGLKYLGGTQPIKEGGWRNTSIAVSEGILYWAAQDERDGVYGFRIDGLKRTGDTERLTSGGWNRTSIAVGGGFFYWAAKDERDALYKSKVSKLTWMGQTECVKSGGWRDEALSTQTAAIAGQSVLSKVRTAKALAASAIQIELSRFAQGNEGSATVTSLRTEGTIVVVEFTIKHRHTWKVLGRTVTPYDVTTPGSMRFNALDPQSSLDASKLCVELPSIIGGQFCMTAGQIARVIVAAG
jgi:hypothetical protein